MPFEKSVPREFDPLTSAEATLAICQQVMRGIAETSYPDPTVCTEFSVARLADHLVGSVRFFGGPAGAEFRPTGAITLGARVADVAQPALEAWRTRGLDGTVKLGRNEVPAALALSILSIEFLVHAWDFAQATGQEVSVPGELAEYVLQIAREAITPEVRRNNGFAAAIPAGPDAAPLDRLIAFTGRAV